MRAVPASEADIPGWLELAAEVEELFQAPMSTDPAFAEMLRRKIREGTAFVVRADDEPPGGVVIGAALWRSSRREVGWFAVARASRRIGVGRTLLEHPLAMAGAGSVSVVTFGEDVPDAQAARRFYERFGFRNAGPAPDTPPGWSRDLYVRG